MIVFIIVSVILLGLLIKFLLDNYKLRAKYGKIIDIDREVDNRSKSILVLEKDIENLRSNYKQKRVIYDELNKKIELYKDDLDMLDIGLYKPVFNFDTSEEFKEKLKKNYEKQKTTIKNKNAVICRTEYIVGGSRKKGRQMEQKNIKLTLRAFNGECDAIIAKVKWHNIQKMKERLTKTYNDINNLMASSYIEINKEYFNLKKEELTLTYECEQKKYEEKEEQRRIREQIREEEKAQKEFEKARLKAEKEEADYQKALQRAHEELAKANNEERVKYEEQIAKLQQELREAEERKQRAISQAQMTKSGNVYIISNIGSFGENVYKIGMTRRLEPEDRVNELGDASVPFKFDIHAMIASDDAPALENKLHEIFKTKSVNRVNYRKEFFRVTLDEIEQAVRECTNADIVFTKIAEAREYKETQAIINSENKISQKQTVNDELPLEI